MKMATNKQRGFAALLALGLAAILGTVGVIAVVEEASDTSGTHLLDTLAGRQEVPGNQQVQMVEDTAKTDSEGTTYIGTSMSMPEQGK